MVHNMWFNTATGQKKPYYQTLHEGEWWDTGTLPIWITAQRQVRGPRRHGYRKMESGSQLSELNREADTAGGR